MCLYKLSRFFDPVIDGSYGYAHYFRDLLDGQLVDFVKAKRIAVFCVHIPYDLNYFIDGFFGYVQFLDGVVGNGKVFRLRGEVIVFFALVVYVDARVARYSRNVVFRFDGSVEGELVVVFQHTRKRFL